MPDHVNSTNHKSCITVPIESVKLDETNISIKKDTCFALRALIFPAYSTNKILNWTSSDTSVARVVNGTVIAVSEGSATITAMAVEESKASDTCLVTVR